MLILSISNNSHDASVVCAENYEILSAIQTERLTRIKKDGRGVQPLTVHESLRVAGADSRDVDVVVMSRGFADAQHLHWPPLHTLKYATLGLAGIRKQKSIIKRCVRRGTTDVRHIFRANRFLTDLNAPIDAHLFFCNHHFSHALSSLFFTDWSEALLYTADGGGDSVFYSMYDFTNGEINEIYGDRNALKKPGVHSLGLAYGYMTEALGYKMNRHEGKLTGLAAYGKPAVYNELAHGFSVSKDGIIHSNFATHNDMKSFIFNMAEKTSPENAAASVQELLENLVTRSIEILLQKTNRSRVGLAGGVFSNVTLNQKIAGLSGVDEVFIFPGMGDEGIAVGGLYEFLLERDGTEKWLSCRRQLHNLYWGGKYDSELALLFDGESDIKKIGGDVEDKVSQLLADGKIIALFCGRMEFGPRALGGRSILASPMRQDINNVLNKRLGRTEFMPFAPYVLEEDADEVFHLPNPSRYAARFMTITCKVRREWRDKIPAVVHVDGTARPQVILDKDNPLYASILRRFKERTGLPVLVNTSFNAHEEPIIHLPHECLRALRDERVDYVAGTNGLWCLRTGRSNMAC